MWKDEKSDALAQEEANNIRKEIEKKSSAFELKFTDQRTYFFVGQFSPKNGLNWLRNMVINYCLLIVEKCQNMEIQKKY